MIRSSWLMALVVAGILAGACGTARQVTTSHWVDPDVLLVGYVGVAGGEQQGRVKVCRRQTDNRLLCRDASELNRLLNEAFAPAPTSPPAEGSERR